MNTFSIAALRHSFVRDHIPILLRQAFHSEKVFILETMQLCAPGETESESEEGDGGCNWCHASLTA